MRANAIAIAAAAILLSGCSGHAADTAALPTRIDTGTSTAATSPLFTPDMWQRLPAKPVPDTAPLGSDGLTYGSRPRPGLRVMQDAGDHTVDCTAGPLVRNRAAAGLGFVTVGHCDKVPGGDVFAYTDGDSPDRTVFGRYVRSDRFGGTLLALDSGVTPDPAATRWGPFRAAGVIPADQIPAALPTGSPICVLTSRDAVRCGETLGVNTNHLSATFVDSGLAPGDSGSLLFAVAKNGDAYGVSLLTDTGAGADPRYNTATSVYLSPILDRLGVDLVTG